MVKNNRTYEQKAFFFRSNIKEPLLFTKKNPSWLEPTSTLASLKGNST